MAPGSPEALFEARLAESPLNTLFSYDVTADGKRFLLDRANVDTAGSTAAGCWMW